MACPDPITALGEHIQELLIVATAQTVRIRSEFCAVTCVCATFHTVDVEHGAY